jgi:hypothetical protein
MSEGIEFDEDKLKYAPRPNAHASLGSYSAGQYGVPNTNEPRMIQWLMKKGIITSPAAGQVVLIAFVIINIIITFVVIKFIL